MKKTFKILLAVCGLGIVACSSPQQPAANQAPANGDAKPETKPEAKPAAAAVDLSGLKTNARLIGPAKSAEQASLEAAHAKAAANTDANNPIGAWSGQFGTNKITLIIEEIGDGKAKGHSVCAGNYRAISGTASENAGVYTCVLNEPGNDKYDGRFEFSIDVKKGSLSGKWSPFKNSVQPKTYTLSKASLAYDPSKGQFPEASQRVLAEADVENRDGEELATMRNEIYARHGYSFKKKDVRASFEQTDWYIPRSVDVRDDLTDIEVKNIDLITRYEKYYAEAMDEYGR